MSRRVWLGQGQGQGQPAAGMQVCSADECCFVVTTLGGTYSRAWSQAFGTQSVPKATAAFLLL